MHLKDDEISESTIDPADLGFNVVDFENLKGGDAENNAAIIKDILAGQEKGPKKDIVVINAAAAIIVAGLADDFKSAVDLADNAIQDGGAITALKKLIEISNS
jgi:anthranilate phosphoribosyltransferase